MRRVDFIPTKQSRISGDYFISSAYYPSSRMMLKTSVPSVFDFPQHLQKIVSERRQLKKNPPHIEGETVNKGQYFLNNVKLSPSKAELKVFIQEQKKEIRQRQRKIRYQQRKMIVYLVFSQILKRKLSWIEILL